RFPTLPPAGTHGRWRLPVSSAVLFSVGTRALAHSRPGVRDSSLPREPAHPGNPPPSLHRLFCSHPAARFVRSTSKSPPARGRVHSPRSERLALEGELRQEVLRILKGIGHQHRYPLHHASLSPSTISRTVFDWQVRTIKSHTSSHESMEGRVARAAR